MSSTYVHYSTPSSLPSDYALLSRYAAAAGVTNETDDPHAPRQADDSPDINEDNADVPQTSPLLPQKRPRRSSFPTAYVTPFNPTSMGPLPDQAGHRSGPADPAATEHTPLLGPLVPRIAEEVDGKDLSALSSPSHVLWEEVRILAKYTLPVYG